MVGWLMISIYHFLDTKFAFHQIVRLNCIMFAIFFSHLANLPSNLLKSLSVGDHRDNCSDIIERYGDVSGGRCGEDVWRSEVQRRWGNKSSSLMSQSLYCHYCHHRHIKIAIIMPGHPWSTLPGFRVTVSLSEVNIWIATILCHHHHHQCKTSLFCPHLWWAYTKKSLMIFLGSNLACCSGPFNKNIVAMTTKIIVTIINLGQAPAG